MRNNFSKIAFTATLWFALAFTFSCGKHDPDDENEILVSSSSSVKSGNPYSSSETTVTPSSSSGKSSSSGVALSSSINSSSSVNISVIDSNGTFTDTRDNQEYKWIKIGTQTWMAQNLNYKEIPVNPASTKRSSHCYNNIDANCEKYGRLYEWDDAVLVCPDGWHLSSRAEWDGLISFVGTDAGKKLKSTSNDWITGVGTDIYGFGALPGGILITEFAKLNAEGYWWTSTEHSYDPTITSYAKYMNAGNGINEENYWDSKNKGNQYSVRCVKGYSSSSSITYGNVTDSRDGKTYNTVKIGTKTWMAQNLNFAEKGICYNGVVSNCEIYGKLYDWATAMNASQNYNTELLAAAPGYRQGICMAGWHLPSRAEWNDLVSYVEQDASLSYRGGYAAAKKLKAKSSIWGDSYGIDSYGFGALPGGILMSGDFGELNLRGYWWTASEIEEREAYFKTMSSGNHVEDSGGNKTYSYSVRCVKD